MTAVTLTKAGVSVVLVTAGALVLWHQRGITRELRTAVDVCRIEAEEFGRIRTEAQQLAAAAIPASELDRLRALRAELARLRAEPDAGAPGEQPASAQRSSRSSAPADLRAPEFGTTGRVPYQQWKNAGRGTPHAALETMLWSAANGEVDTLAGALTFDPRSQQTVDLFWGQLPQTVREQYGTPARLYAAMTVRDVPLGSAQVLNHSPLEPGKFGIPGPAHTLMVVEVVDDGGNAKRVTLFLRPSETGWQIVVPQEALAKYRHQLLGDTTVQADR